MEIQSSQVNGKTQRINTGLQGGNKTWGFFKKFSNRAPRPQKRQKNAKTH